jgi:hypothetical protein
MLSAFSFEQMKAIAGRPCDSPAQTHKKTHMNTSSSSALASVLLVTACVFVPSTRASGLQGRGLIVDCQVAHLPSQKDVAHLLGTRNFSQTYAERTRLMQTIHRECQRGARQVLVDASDPPPESVATTELAKAH